MKHLIFSSKFILSIFAISSMIFIGCQKEEIKSGETPQKVTTELRTTVTPTVENGTLKFNTKEDVAKYLKEISPLFEEEIPFKHNFGGFTSLYDKSMEGDFQPYFLDDRLNSMLNDNYEIIIGDRIFVKKNLEETWSVLKSDHTGINKLRLKNPGTYFNVEDDSESFIMEDGDKIEVFSILSCKAKIRIIDKTVPNPNFPILSTSNGINTYCVEVFGVQGGNVESITVNWGDGAVTTSKFNQCHTYLNPGDFLITVSVKLTCSSTPFTSKRLVSPFKICCNLKSKDKKEVVVSDLKMRASYERKTFLNSYYWLAKTESFSIGNNPVNAKLTSQITALFRDHSNCNEKSNEGDSDTCNSCRSKKVDLWHNENDDMLNKHADVSMTCTMVRSGLTLTHTFVPDCN